MYIWSADSIQPIALPNGNELWDQFSGAWAVAAGYGKTNDRQYLHFTYVY